MVSPQESDAVVEVKEHVERCFRRIETQRMAGIPILNKAISVEVVGLRRHGDEWLCILVTPWFMNVMLMPAAIGGEPSVETVAKGAVGSKSMVNFPAGQFEMIRGFESDLGCYSMCSLFSPMHEFADHDSARAAAEAALGALLEIDAAPDVDADMATIWRGELPAKTRTATLDQRATDDPAGGQPELSPVAEDDGGEQVALSAGVAQSDQPGPAQVDRRRLLFGRTREERRT